MRHAREDMKERNEIDKSKIKYYVTTISTLVLLILFFRQRSVLGYKTSSFIVVHVIIYTFLGMGCYFFIKEILSKNLKIEKLFLICVIPIGVAYTLLVPPGLVPDEWVHMQNDFSLASQMTGKELNGKCTFRESEIELLSKNVTTPNNEYYNYIYNNIISISQNNNYISTGTDSFALTQLFGYFPSVIGTIVARLLNLGVVTTVYLGRLCNFSFYITLSYFALKKIPFGKLLLFAIALLPMTSHQMFSLSYDAVINATAFLCVGYGMFFVYQSNEVQLKDIILYSLCAILLLANKGSAYAFILVIPILAKYFNPNGDKVAKKTKIIIFLIVVISIILLNYRSITDASHITAIESTSEGLVPWSNTPSHTLTSMVNNIPGTLNIFTNTFIQKGWWYICTAIGSQLGWLSIIMPSWIINTWLGLLLIASIAEKSNKEVFTYEHKSLFFLISLAVILVVMLAMALAWTPMDYDVIEGVQGRYYIPIIYLLLICLQNSRVYLRENMTRIIMVMISVMSVVSIYFLIMLVF